MKLDGSIVRKIGVVVVSAMTSFVSFAANTYTWIPGSTDWDSEDSYEGEGKPGEGDYVLIPAGKVATNKVVFGDAASLASFEAFSKLHTVKLESNTSRLVLDIGEGLVLTNKCKIKCNAGDRQGRIWKCGSGELEFGVSNDANAYLCNLTVAEGTLVLPQKMTSSQFNLGAVVVSNGATLVTAIDSAVGTSTGAGATMVGSLNGDGVITNRCSRGRRLGFNVASTTSRFSGRIRPRVLIWPANYDGVQVNLTGTESDTAESVYLSSDAVLGAAKFGLKGGQPSSIGKVSDLYWRGPGTFKYIGEGEDTTDKNFYTWTTANSPLVIDGGNGGLTMTGTLKGSESSPASEVRGMIRLTLCGDGALTNVFSGTLPSWKCKGETITNYNFHITKKGAGIWRFAAKSQTHAGAWTIEDGTLQFESLNQRGVACSLGTSTNCLESYTGLINESKRVPWAFALGGATTSGTLEYVGTDKVFCMTRPILLKGKGGTLKNSSDKTFVFGGASSAAGESVALTLAGDTAATNEIWNVTDGDGTTSLVKDGSGTWALCGTNNNFSGTVTVKNGTLVVKNLSEFNYDWFRWTIKARNGTDTKNHDVRAAELGIYDASGNRMNGGLTTYAGYGTKPVGSLPAGMAGYGHPSMSSDQNSSRPLAALFDDGTPIESGWTQLGYTGMAEIAENAESTWISVIMHLADNSARAKTFDVAQGNFSNFYAYKKFSMEGSIDGIHWDVLTNTVDATVGANYWSFSDKKYTAGSAATHTGGCPIAGGPEGIANALDGAGSSVSVAAGARLVAQGAATIPGLTIDAAGAGTVEGFEFAENGTLVVKNMPKGGGVLPGTYVNCTGFENIANWTLYDADKGREARGSTIVVSNGEIRIVAPGALLIVR